MQALSWSQHPSSSSKQPMWACPIVPCCVMCSLGLVSGLACRPYLLLSYRTSRRPTWYAIIVPKIALLSSASHKARAAVCVRHALPTLCPMLCVQNNYRQISITAAIRKQRWNSSCHRNTMPALPVLCTAACIVQHNNPASFSGTAFDKTYTCCSYSVINSC